MLVTKLAVLAIFYTTRMFPLVFGSIVITPVAFATGQCNFVSRHLSAIPVYSISNLLSYLCDNAGADSAAALADGEA
jgi:hypothetical protein